MIDASSASPHIYIIGDRTFKEIMIEQLDILTCDVATGKYLQYYWMNESITEYIKSKKWSKLQCRKQVTLQVDIGGLERW